MPLVRVPKMTSAVLVDYVDAAVGICLRWAVYLILAALMPSTMIGRCPECAEDL